VKPPCGTQAAYQWHRRHGETPHETDYQAEAAYRKHRRALRAALGRVKQEAMIREAVRVLAEAMGASR
jgi:hypothetical protein